MGAMQGETVATTGEVGLAGFGGFGSPKAHITGLPVILDEAGYIIANTVAIRILPCNRILIPIESSGMAWCLLQYYEWEQ